jgi:hypothetical protein
MNNYCLNPLAKRSRYPGVPHRDRISMSVTTRPLASATLHTAQQKDDFGEYNVAKVFKFLMILRKKVKFLEFLLFGTMCNFGIIF